MLVSHYMTWCFLRKCSPLKIKTRSLRSSLTFSHSKPGISNGSGYISLKLKLSLRVEINMSIAEKYSSYSVDKIENLSKIMDPFTNFSCKFFWKVVEIYRKTILLELSSRFFVSYYSFALLLQELGNNNKIQ